MKLNPIPLLLLLTAVTLLLVACGGGQASGTPVQETTRVERATVEPAQMATPAPEPPPPTSTPVPLATSTMSSGAPSSESLAERLIAPGEALVTLSDGSSARYLVKEQLARLDIPNDAIGVTNQIQGYVKIGADGTIQQDVSKITIDLRTLHSDQQRRDEYLNRNSLESDAFPFAEFVVRKTLGLDWPLPVAGNAEFQLIGDMTIHGETSPLTWDVDVTISPEGGTGQARTSFPFGTFDMEIPRLFFVLSVEDNIRLELDLVFDIVLGR